MENRNKFDFNICYDKLTLVNDLLKQVNCSYNDNEKESTALKKIDKALDNDQFFLLAWHLSDYTIGTLEHTSGVARMPLFTVKSNIMKSMDI